MEITRRQLLAAGVGGLALVGARPAAAATASMPSRAAVLSTVERVNDHWIGANTDPGNNAWARATYFAGLTTLYRTTRRARHLSYAQGWAEKWDYGLNPGPAIAAANDQCAGQAYFDLYDLAPDPHKIAAIVASVEHDVTGPADAWWWVDALHMAMPSYVRVAAVRNDPAVLTALWNRYRSTRIDQKLWSGADGLWFRDATFLPPDGIASPSGVPMYWSRGNGWAFVAHAKILQFRPGLASSHTAYLSTFRAMAAAVRSTQRPDGFWNVDLHDASDYPGPEASGTSMFLFGLATGIRLGLLSRSVFLPVATRAWNALATTAVRPDGSLGWVQGVGKQPSSSQPVTATSTADYGVGAFTSAGCALAALLT